MTDLHTHILPGMDDGAEDVQQSLAMLKLEGEQGVKTVALTPHFYPGHESLDSFLKRREEAWQQLKEEIAASPEADSLPQLRLGAEVAYIPGMCEWQELPQLCYDGTKLLLIELPFAPWNEELFRELYRISTTRGITPIIAHLDRYLHCQKANAINRLLDMAFPYQVSAAAVMQPFSRRAKELFLCGGVPVSDCHDVRHRPPNLGKLRSFVLRKYGREEADALSSRTEVWNEI